MSHILTLTTFAPLVGALAILILRAVAGKSGEQAAGRSALWIALGTTVATFALSVIMLVRPSVQSSTISPGRSRVPGCSLACSADSPRSRYRRKSTPGNSTEPRCLRMTCILG